MLPFEREVVGALVDPALDEDVRAAITADIDASLRSMPEYLRAGVVVGSQVMRGWSRLTRALGRSTPMTEQVERWKTSRIDAIRQYVRVFHSLVLFAEYELAPARVGREAST